MEHLGYGIEPDGDWDIDHGASFLGFCGERTWKGLGKSTPGPTQRKSTQNFIMTVSMAQMRDGQSYSCLC